MDSSQVRYVISRAVTAILLIIAVLYGFSIFKKKQRKDKIFADLKSVCSDSSYFRQFDPADAQKTLIRGVGLVAEAKQMGIDPNDAISRGLGIEEKYFLLDEDKSKDEAPIREQIIRNSLRSNYENLIKVGYTADFHTLGALKKGELPPVRTGPQVGMRGEIGMIIDPTLSPGLDLIVANLEIRPPKKPGTKMTDVEITAAKQLAKDLLSAKILEKEASDRIIEHYTPKVPEVEPKK